MLLVCYDSDPCPYCLMVCKIVLVFIWTEHLLNRLQFTISAPHYSPCPWEACRQAELSCLPQPVGVGEELVVWRG